MKYLLIIICFICLTGLVNSKTVNKSEFSLDSMVVVINKSINKANQNLAKENKLQVNFRGFLYKEALK